MSIEVEITNPDKIFWPKEGYTKRDMVGYYRKITPYILPYLKDRPQSLHRFPDGIKGERFYQKNVDHTPPDWVKVVPIESESKGEIDFIVVENPETVIYLANLGCIEINPWSSRYKKPLYPDWTVIDLDPQEVSFESVIKAALTVHEVLEELGVGHYPKTSGATGLHIYIPLHAAYTYGQAKSFAHLIATAAHKRLPQLTSLERLPNKRKGKVYLDFLQNSLGQTLVAPYSLRPREGAPVSTPLDWSEVTEGLDPNVYNIQTIFQRLEKTGDLFKPVLTEKTDILKILKSFSG